MANRFQRQFLEIERTETIIAHGVGACLLTDWDELNNFYAGPSIDSSYQFFGSFRQEVSENNFRN